MARVLVAPAAMTDLERMIATHSLPADTRSRVLRPLQPLERFPLLGAPLEGRWSRYRFILGPWRWMLIVYRYETETETVAVVTVQDARSANQATSNV